MVLTSMDQISILLTLSPPIPLSLYTLPCWSNPPLLIFDIRAVWRSVSERQTARMSKIKNDGLDQHGAEPFRQQQFGTAGVEGVNSIIQCVLRENQAFVHLRYTCI